MNFGLVFVGDTTSVLTRHLDQLLWELKKYNQHFLSAPRYKATTTNNHTHRWSCGSSLISNYYLQNSIYCTVVDLKVENLWCFFSLNEDLVLMLASFFRTGTVSRLNNLSQRVLAAGCQVNGFSSKKNEPDINM